MKAIRQIVTVLLAAASLASASAQTRADSLAVSAPERWRPAETRWIPAVIGAGLIAEGAIGAATHTDADRIAPNVAGKHSSVVADVAQYVPLAFPWAMKAFGAPTRSSWARMAVSQAFGTAIMAGGVYVTKHAVSERRPDGTDRRSFPSGHSAWAFMGATYTAIELGDVSPWYAAGAYAFATGVAVQRAVADRHHAADVVAGAGLGIAAAELGYYIGDVIFGNRGLSRPALSFEPDRPNPSFVSLTTSLLWPVGHISIGNGSIVRHPAVSAGFKGGLALGDHWGITLSALLLSTPLQIDRPLGSTYIGNQSSVGLIVSPYYTYALSNRISLTAEAGAGYYKNLRLRSIDRAISTGWGTPEGHLSVGTVINLTDHVSCKASVGYQLMHYSYSVRPSTAYLVTEPARASGTTGGITVGLSTRINLP